MTDEIPTSERLARALKGPLEVRNPRSPDGPRITAAWWCANCHHAILAKAEEATQ